MKRTATLICGILLTGAAIAADVVLGTSPTSWGGSGANRVAVWTATGSSYTPYGLQFPGVNYSDVKMNTSLSLGTTNTISFWMRYPGLYTGTMAPIAGTNNGTAYEYIGTYYSGNLATRTLNYNPYYNVGVTVPWLWTTGVWHHICTIQDGLAVQIYIDGVSQTNGTLPSLYGFDLARFGASYLGASFTWQGQLDEVNAWTRNLNASEVTNLYAGGSGVRADVTVTPWNSQFAGGWHLDEGTGTNITGIGGASAGTLEATNVIWITGKIQ